MGPDPIAIAPATIPYSHSRGSTASIQTTDRQVRKRQGRQDDRNRSILVGSGPYTLVGPAEPKTLGRQPDYDLAHKREDEEQQTATRQRIGSLHSAFRNWFKTATHVCLSHSDRAPICPTSLPHHRLRALWRFLHLGSDPFGGRAPTLQLPDTADLDV